jgi:hypothetical protein
MKCVCNLARWDSSKPPCKKYEPPLYGKWGWCLYCAHDEKCHAKPKREAKPRRKK